MISLLLQNFDNRKSVHRLSQDPETAASRGQCLGLFVRDFLVLNRRFIEVWIEYFLTAFTSTS